MRNEFDAEGFDDVNAERAHVPSHSFGHNRQCELDVRRRNVLSRRGGEGRGVAGGSPGSGLSLEDS
jgi:hypothetical protein